MEETVSFDGSFVANGLEGSKMIKTGIAGDSKPKPLRNDLFWLYLRREEMSFDFFVANGLGRKMDENRHRRRFQTQAAAKWFALPVFG